MRKNKTIMRLVSKILFICLVVNTLPASFSVHAKTLTPREIAALRAEVNREIGKIKREINVLKVVKFAIPGIVLVGGAALTIVGTALAGWLFNKYKKKLANKFKTSLEAYNKLKSKHKPNIKTLESLVENIQSRIYDIESRKKDISDLNDKWTKFQFFSDNNTAKETFYKIFEGDPQFKLTWAGTIAGMDKVKEAIKQKASPLTIIEIIKTYLSPQHLPKLEKKSKKLTKKITLLKNLLENKPDDTSKTILTASTIIVPILTALSGFIVTGLLSGLAFTGFSWASLNAAVKGANRLEKIEKELPGVLTRRQKDVLSEFKKLSGDVAVKGFIQNVRLKNALAATITTALQQHPFLIELLGGEKQARKTFEKYVKLRWEEQLLQKAVEEGARASSLNKAKRKIEKLEKKLYSQLKKIRPGQAESNFKKLQSALNSASQTYATQANRILEELRDQIIESIETGKLKLQKEARKAPIVPLGL